MPVVLLGALFAIIGLVALVGAEGPKEAAISFTPKPGQLDNAYCTLVRGPAKTLNDIVRAVWNALYPGIPLPNAGSPAINQAAYIGFQRDVMRWLESGMPCGGPPAFEPDEPDEPPPVEPDEPSGPVVVVDPFFPVEPDEPDEPPPVEPDEPEPGEPEEPDQPLPPKPEPDEPDEPPPVEPDEPEPDEPDEPDVPDVDPSEDPNRPDLNDDQFVQYLMQPRTGGGYFMAMKQGDYGVKISQGIVPGASNKDIWNCIQRVMWNVRMYGASAQPGEYTITNEDGLTWSLNKGFLPRHQDPNVILVLRQAPKRTIKWSGTKITGVQGATSYMMAWIPQMKVHPQFGLVCVAEDGSDPQVNPPQRLFTMLGIADVREMG